MHRTFKLINPVSKHYLTYLSNFWRNAGHSKWQNIRHIKAEKDAERAAIFNRLRRLMQVAIQEGKSADPSANLQLAQVIQQARKANMPSTTINDAIKTENAKFQNANNDVVTIGISGPGGSAFIVCVVTSNLVELKSRINPILKKLKFAAGVVAHLFDSKSVIQTDFPVNSSLEDAINVAIELDADDVVQVNEDGHNFLQFTGASELLKKLKTQLEIRKYRVHSAEVTYTPLAQVTITNENLESVNLLYKKLEALPEIVDIYDNIAWPDNF